MCAGKKTFLRTSIARGINCVLCIDKKTPGFLTTAGIVRKNGRKSYDSASCVDLSANTYLALAEKKIPRYHTIFFLAAGFKLALLVKV